MPPDDTHVDNHGYHYSTYNVSACFSLFAAVNILNIVAGISEDSDYTSDVGYPAVGSTPSGSHPPGHLLPQLQQQPNAQANVNPSAFGGAPVIQAHLQLHEQQQVKPRTLFAARSSIIILFSEKTKILNF